MTESVEQWLASHNRDEILREGLRVHLAAANQDATVVSKTFGISVSSVYRCKQDLDTKRSIPLVPLTQVQQDWIDLLRSFWPHNPPLQFDPEGSGEARLRWPSLALQVREQQSHLWIEWSYRGQQYAGPVGRKLVDLFLDHLKGEGGPLQFTKLPWPPSINHYYVRAGNRVVLSSKARTFRRDLRAKMHAQMMEHYPEAVRCMPLTDNLEVRVRLHPPDSRIRDVDNYYKALFDGLTQAGLWEDDRQVKITTTCMEDPVEGGEVDVVVLRQMEMS